MKKAANRCTQAAAELDELLDEHPRFQAEIGQWMSEWSPEIRAELLATGKFQRERQGDWAIWSNKP